MNKSFNFNVKKLDKMYFFKKNFTKEKRNMKIKTFKINFKRINYSIDLKHEKNKKLEQFKLTLKNIKIKKNINIRISLKILLFITYNLKKEKFKKINFKNLITDLKNKFQILFIKFLIKLNNGFKFEFDYLFYNMINLIKIIKNNIKCLNNKYIFNINNFKINSENNTYKFYIFEYKRIPKFNKKIIFKKNMNNYLILNLLIMKLFTKLIRKLKVGNNVIDVLKIQYFFSVIFYILYNYFIKKNITIKNKLLKNNPPGYVINKKKNIFNNNRRININYLENINEEYPFYNLINIEKEFLIKDIKLNLYLDILNHIINNFFN